MILSSRLEYACIAVMELALRRDGEPARIRSIAEAHGIPSRFLVQILLQLKGAGLVRSTRGASGGYQLAQPPERISLAEVMEAVDGPLLAAPDSAAAETPLARALHATWQEAADSLRRRLADVSVADLVERAGAKTDNMYYI